MRVCEVIDRPVLPLSPVYEKIEKKKKNVKFINKINIFIITKTQTKHFAKGLKFFKTALSRVNYVHFVFM